jgi:hypothetical protein
MNESDDLFELIQRLSKAEKKYFQQYAALYEGKNAPLYLKLFHALCKQHHPSDSELKKILGAGQGSNKLATTRHYLYKLILRVLHAFHAGNNEQLDLYDLLSESNLLIRKGLDKQATKILNKAEKKAEEMDDLYALDIIFLAKYNINRSSKDFLEELFVPGGSFEKAMKRTLKRQEVLKYMKLRCEIGMIYGEAGHDMRSKETNDRVLSIYHEVIQPSSLEDPSLLGKVYQMETVEFSGFLLRYNKERIVYLEKSAAFFEKYDKISHAPHNCLLSSYQNLCTAYFQNGEEKKFKTARAKLEKLQARDFRSEIKLFDAKAHVDIGYLLVNGSFDELLKVLPEIEVGLKKYASFIPDRKSLGILYYLIGLSYFFHSMFKYSLIWFNKIVNMPVGDPRQDMYKFARLFTIFIHYELDNMDGSDYLIASLKRLYKKVKESHFEKKVLAGLQSLNNAFSKEEKAKELETFKQVLLQLKDDPAEAQMFLYFDFLEWIEAKQRGITLIELLKEKSNLTFDR